jgi:hypothetical protein
MHLSNWYDHYYHLTDLSLNGLDIALFQGSSFEKTGRTSYVIARPQRHTRARWNGHSYAGNRALGGLDNYKNLGE